MSESHFWQVIFLLCLPKGQVYVWEVNVIYTCIIVDFLRIRWQYLPLAKQMLCICINIAFNTSSIHIYVLFYRSVMQSQITFIGMFCLFVCLLVCSFFTFFNLSFWWNCPHSSGDNPTACIPVNSEYIWHVQWNILWPNVFIVSVFEFQAQWELHTLHIN